MQAAPDPNLTAELYLRVYGQKNICILLHTLEHVNITVIAKR